MGGGDAVRGARSDPRLALWLLGPPRIEMDGEPCTFDTRKAVAMLARIAMEGPQGRDTLAALLWPESDTRRARGALRRTLASLRSGIESTALAVDRNVIALDPAGYTSDVSTFRSLVARAAEHHDHPARTCDECLDGLSAAVDLHRGEFLAGFALRDSAAFDDWQVFQADALEAELAAALDRLVVALVHRDDLDGAIVHALRRSALDPLHEPTHRRLMLMHAWAGQRHAAVRQYRDCVTILDQELGVAPLAETTDLHDAILAGTAPPRPVAGAPTVGGASVAGESDRATARERREGRLPLPMVGREGVLVELEHACTAGDGGCLVVVEGEAGIGRTRLLAALADRRREAGATVMSVRCHPGEELLAYGPIADSLRAVLADPDRGSVPPSWLSEVTRLVPELADGLPGLPVAPPLGSREADRRFFEGVRRTLAAAGSPASPALLVMEDLQWVDTASLDVVGYLARRLAETPICLVLAWRSEEVGRDHPLRRLVATVRPLRHVVLDRLDRDAVARLVREAGMSDLDMADGRDPVDVLVSETDGLPLFVSAYLDAMRDPTPSGDAAAVPAGVRDLVEQRLIGLSDTARQVLTAAAVVGRSVDFDTLLHVSGRDEEETVDALDELLAGDLVAEADNGPERVAFELRHHALRTVVYEQASIARRRLLHARAAEALRRSGDGQGPLALVAEHLRQAGREADAAIAFADAAARSVSLAALSDAVEHYRAALALGHPEAATLHEALGDVLTRLGEYADALLAYQAAAGTARSPADLARAEHRLAGVQQRRGDWAAAEAHLDAAVALLPREEHAGQRARLEGERALAAHRRGATADAVDRAAGSLSLAEASGDLLAAAQAHNMLGILCRSQGATDQAITHLQRSCDLADEVDDLEARVAALNNLALAFGDAGDLAQALEVGKTALAQCRSAQDRHREAAILNNLADLLRAAGQEEEAMSHLKQAVGIFAEVGEDAVHEPEIWKLVEW